MAVPSFDLINGAKFPAVGLGTYTITPLSGPFFLPLKIIDDKKMEKAIDNALENGYRHIDTDYKYTALIGRVLKKWFDSGRVKRENLFVTTKLPTQGVHPDRVDKYIKFSLEDLQLDYVDLYLIYFPVCTEQEPISGLHVNPEPIDLVAVWQKLEEQVNNGRCKAIGVSNFNQEQVERILKNCTIPPAANQVELNVYLQQPKLVQFLQDNNIVPISYSSLGNPDFEEHVRKFRRLRSTDKVESLLEDPTVADIAKKYQKSPAQILLKFLVQKGIAVIPKSTNEKRLKENISLFDFNLDDADIQLLKQLDKKEAGRKSKWDFGKKMITADEYPWK